MNKGELIKQCNALIAEIEVEIKEQDFLEAIPLLQDFFLQLKKLEENIGGFGNDDEKHLEKIVQTLANIDTEKIKDMKELFLILTSIESSIQNLKNQILIGESGDLMEILSQIRNALNIVSMKI